MVSKNSLTIREVNHSTAEEIKKYFCGLKMYTDFILVGEKGYFFPKSSYFTDQISTIDTMSIRPNDIFVLTFPRSGTTLTQELVWLVANNLNYKTAESKHLFERYISLGSFIVNPQIQIEDFKNSVHFDKVKNLITPLRELLANSSNPRFIKCHMPFSMLPSNALENAKFIYIARDPRDVAVSLYHLSKLLTVFGFTGDFKTFWNFFVRGLVVRAPYFEHVKEAWKMKNHPNMLFLFYENITKDIPEAIRQVSDFLSKKYTDEQISKLSEHLEFDNFKCNQSVNLEVLNDFNALLKNAEPFVRKGKSGGWRDYFDKEMSKQADQWIEENLLDTDLKFPAH